MHSGAVEHRVRVPASTSNLGPGFDALGIALSLFLEVRVVGASDAHVLATATGEAADWPAEGNLLFRAFDRARGEEAAGGFRFAVHSAIPIERGLGSSAAAIAAGLLLGARVAGREADLLTLGIELEGHPDNVTPALRGGARLCVPAAGGPLVLHPAIHPSLAFAVAWPEARVATGEARAVLPHSVPFADAVENARRLPLFLEGLRTADGALLRAGGKDRLHEKHRLPLIPGGERALAAALEAGAWTSNVSGSGSALVAIAPRGSAPAAADAMADSFRAETGSGTAVVADVVNDAPGVTSE